MADSTGRPPKAYRNIEFLLSRDARSLRLLSEYLEPEQRFRRYRVEDTIVFFGSARARPVDEATQRLEEARREGTPDEVARAEAGLRLAGYYRDAEELAYRLTCWSKGLAGTRRRFLIASGGGPGIMEAANRGAGRARGINVGLGISLPKEPSINPYVSRELAFEFHYFFTRKFWFVYLAKAVVVFPGGFGTMDELFELLTLIQTEKVRRPLPIVLYGREYWNAIVDFDALKQWGVIDPDDLGLLHPADSVEDAFDYLRDTLARTYELDEEGSADSP